LDGGDEPKTLERMNQALVQARKQVV